MKCKLCQQFHCEDTRLVALASKQTIQFSCKHYGFINKIKTVRKPSGLLFVLKMFRNFLYSHLFFSFIRPISKLSGKREISLDNLFEWHRFLGLPEFLSGSGMTANKPEICATRKIREIYTVIQTGTLCNFEIWWTKV